MRSSPRWKTAALVLLLGVAVVVTFLLLRPKRIAEPGVKRAGAFDPTLPNAPKTPHLAPAFPAQQAERQGLPAPSLAQLGPLSEDEFRAQMAQMRQLLLQKLRYPSDSSPLALKTDQLKPHQVDPVTRGLSSTGHVQITQWQDRVWVSPGQPAIVTLTTKLEGQAVPPQIESTSLVRHLDGQPDAAMGQVAFADDGNPPDQIAGDGVWSGLVATPTDGAGASLTLTVQARAGDESGIALYQFVQTASAPAVFTQTARDALEQGLIAIYVGISVQRPGQYHIQGRLWDSTGSPIAFMIFQDNLDVSSKEVRLSAYGKIVLDEGGIPPFVLKDVEGWRDVLGQYPDRELMDDWPAGYTTAAYSILSAHERGLQRRGQAGEARRARAGRERRRRQHPQRRLAHGGAGRGAPTDALSRVWS